MLVTAQKRTARGRVWPRSARGRVRLRSARRRVRLRSDCGRVRLRSAWGQIAMLAGVVTLASFALPSGIGTAAPAATPPSLAALVAMANKLSNEIDSLSQEYDGLRIQLAQARDEVKIANQTALRDEKLITAGQVAVGKIAAQGYMTGALNPALQLLQSNNPQAMLNRASIIVQLQQENGSKITAVAAAEAAAKRALLTAAQAERQAAGLSAAMKAKVAVIQKKENVLNSAAYSKAMSIYQKTGKYPYTAPVGSSIGAQALRFALTRLGDPYVWGAAGPSAFDCSGLVMWAYAQVGISLLHFTGDQWNEGEHIPRSQLQPGDLVFFFQDLGHVGMYIGNGLMINAPTFGQPVQVAPVFWSAYMGAVRIAG
jgi:cell wall-associated NlpC family hydrolase